MKTLPTARILPVCLVLGAALTATSHAAVLLTGGTVTETFATLPSATSWSTPAVTFGTPTTITDDMTADVLVGTPTFPAPNQDGFH